MTEAEWLACTDPEPMLAFLHGKVSDRRFRLFSVGCIRRGWHLSRDPGLWQGVEAVERFVDGLTRDKARIEARKTGLRVAHAETGSEDGYGNPQEMLGFELWEVAKKTIDLKTARDLGTSAAAAFGYAAVEGSHDGPKFFRAKERERKRQRGVLLDIFGNPFRPATIPVAWRVPQVVALAQSAYDQRMLPAGTLDLPRLAILADALEEAGCTDAGLLAHLRGPGPHVRGCWALDLLLGKG